MSYQYIKKPVIVDAVEIGSLNYAEMKELADFTGQNIKVCISKNKNEKDGVEIQTLAGTVKAVVGDHVIKGTRGEIYPCNHAVFSDVYELYIASETKRKNGFNSVIAANEDTILLGSEGKVKSYGNQHGTL